MSALIVTVPGASEQELAERTAAALAVFERRDINPYAAARASFLRDGLDDESGPEAPGLSVQDFDAAEAWLEAIEVALADREGWTKAPPESDVELVIPRG